MFITYFKEEAAGAVQAGPVFRNRRHGSLICSLAWLTLHAFRNATEWGCGLPTEAGVVQGHGARCI